MKYFYLIIAVAIISFIIGRKSKKDTIVTTSTISEKITIDTFFKKVPILDSNKKILKKELDKKTTILDSSLFYKNKFFLIKDSLSNIEEPINEEIPIYSYNDSLYSDDKKIGLKLSIKGNCFGLTEKNYQFFGFLEEKTITKEVVRTIQKEKKGNIFNIYAGVSSDIDKEFYKTLQPTIYLIVKDKRMLNYGYRPYDNKHNVGVSFLLNKK